MSMTLLLLSASIFYSARYGEVIGWRLMKVPGQQLVALFVFLLAITWDVARLYLWFRR